ncbi:MAG TPA: DUF485 domain-containing protein [Candidatus Sulfotelmatobacter sp.]|nr:DUF485 domain-containing protein [Candidatus Sulfotelmatobacter sp.]
MARHPAYRPQEADWNRIASSQPFQHLLAIKKIFIVPAFLFIVAYYLLLPVLVGYAPRLMSTRVVGTVTVAYLFALSEFVVGWIIAWMYLKASSRFDRLVDDVLGQDLSQRESQTEGRR